MVIHMYGDKSGKVAVLLHPMGFSGREIYEHFKPYYSGEYYFIVPDMGNHGKETAEFLSIDEEMEELHRFLQENDIKNIALLHGLSMGAAGALVLMRYKDLTFDRIYLDGAPLAKQGFVMSRIFGPVLIWTRNSMRKDMEKANREYIERYGQVLGNAMGRNFLKFTDASIMNIARACVRGNDYPIDEDLQASITFDWGSDELYTKTSKPLVEKIYPGAEVIVRDKMQHCEFMAKHPEKYIKCVEGRTDYKELGMEADYKNWVPKGMVYGLLVGTAAFGAGLSADIALTKNASGPVKTGSRALFGIGTACMGTLAAWSVMAHDRFSYKGKRKMSRQIIEGTANYVKIPDGGCGLDVGCGSGALTIACAKRNPNARMIGMDRWGAEYASFSKRLCEDNARAEGVENVSFENGDAIHLAYDDETFDAVTSNYVYHNISGKNKQELLLETLRVLKKGGTFAIHDIMSKARYGDMQAFVKKLNEDGYEDVRLIPTDQGLFMSKAEAAVMMLSGSALLVGKKRE